MEEIGVEVGIEWVRKVRGKSGGKGRW